MQLERDPKLLPETEALSRGRAIARLAARIVVIGVVVYFLSRILGWANHQVAILGDGQSTLVLSGVIIMCLIAYAALIAIPFVPGIEIGIGLLVLRGAEIAPYVYVATVVGLSTAYLIGRYVPVRWLHQTTTDLGLKKLASLILRAEILPREERLELLRSKLPSWLAGWLLTSRYLALAALVNLPGTALIGGGGGILMVAGLTRLFSSRAIIVTLALATAPVPLAVYVFGSTIFGPFSILGTT